MNVHSRVQFSNTNRDYGLEVILTIANKFIEKIYCFICSDQEDPDDPSWDAQSGMGYQFHYIQ